MNNGEGPGELTVTLRPSCVADLLAYTDLLQSVYESTYTNPEIGLTAECFSKGVFNSEGSQEYLKVNLKNDESQKTLLAFVREQLVGSITVTHHGKDCEIRGFYVASDAQGRGVGKRLWSEVQPFAYGKDFILDLYVHNTRAIEMYESWGFELDTSRGENGYFYRHWPEWPEDVQARCMYMRRPAQ